MIQFQMKLLFSIYMRDYQPFAYPPSFELARIHQQASMPGKVASKSAPSCPCCQEPIKQEFPTWLNRSIQSDFSKYGGSVVTYFWLVKLYACISALIVAVYSIYLIVCIHENCSFDRGCQEFIAVWIVSNEALYSIMKEIEHHDVIVRLFTLRGMAFGILLFGNAFSLYLVGKFKRRYPPPKDISNFAIIFKNVKVSPQDLTLDLKSKFPDLEIKQLFGIKKLQPFYSTYQQKLALYYQTLNEDDPKKKQKLLQKLSSLDDFCTKEEPQMDKLGDRVILVVNDENDRKAILQEYTLSRFQKIRYVGGFTDDKLYCEPCPTPQEIIWNYIGLEEKQKIKVKILSVLYFFILLFGSYGLLFFCMKIVYRQVLPAPYNFILANIILIILVIIALTFRFLMNKLSEMRYPNTQTSRTMFIVVTTVLFHFLYYIIIPTLYYWQADDNIKNKTLLVITNQTVNFLIVQFILAAVDLMHCCWTKRKRKVQNEEKPVGCQKILHMEMQYPRFPIEFKLIILFKTYSFIIFFAFQVPFIMVFTLLLLLYLYFKDKHSVYYHYRMEIIDNGVQIKFLKIYTNFFSLYTFIIFILTQHLEVEIWIALGLTVASMITQTFLIRQRKNIDDDALPSTIDQLGLNDSYRRRYTKFVSDIVSDSLDLQIKQYLNENGHGSVQTEESLKERLK